MNCLITTYLTGGIDPQRGDQWKIDDFSIMENYYNSVLKHNIPLFILHYDLSDEFTKQWTNNNVNFVKVNRVKLNLVDDRWKLYHDFIESHSDISLAFFTDISDVVVLNNPFLSMNSNNVYSGDERGIILESKWLRERYKLLNDSTINSHLSLYKNKKRLNSGLLGGNRQDLCDITKKISDHLSQWKITDRTIEMIAFNDVLRTYYNNKIIHGHPINTPFKSYNMEIKNAWFRHK